jgi:hypothetical protein
MSFDPPPLPPQGYLLAELGMLEESMAAIAIDLSVQTLVEYRKKQIGPDYTVVGRTILYSPENLKAWLKAGGTRAVEAEGTQPRNLVAAMDVALGKPKTAEPKKPYEAPKPARKRGAR